MCRLIASDIFRLGSIYSGAVIYHVSGAVENESGSVLGASGVEEAQRQIRALFDRDNFLINFNTSSAKNSPRKFSATREAAPGAACE